MIVDYIMCTNVHTIHCVVQLLEKADRRGELEDVVWNHFEEEIVPEIRAYQIKIQIELQPTRFAITKRKVCNIPYYWV